MPVSTPPVEKRLNKFISESGFCSRREADRLVEQNRVTINGKSPELGTKVLPGDDVRVDGQSIMAMPEDKTDRVYIAYNKPIGITCTTESQVKGNIIHAIGHSQRIFPIGRLDKPSEGLIFLTSDGDIVNKILRAENAHDKEYVVTVDKPVTDDFVRKMSNGVPILDTVTKPCEVKINSRFVFTIILTQGLNRQIRRMAEYLGYSVTKLKRSRIMNVHLGKLAVGQWRDLTQQEMDEINNAVTGSSKTSSIKGEMNARHLKSTQRAISEESADKAERTRESAGKAHRSHAENNRGRSKEPAKNKRRGSSLTGKYHKK
jgi:pseudouridine synthase